MPVNANGRLRRLRSALIALGLGSGCLIVLVALVLDWGLAREVILIVPHDEASIEINRALHSPGDPVADIYGLPSSDPVRVVAPRWDRIIQPTEAPGILLLKVDKQIGENPLQVQTVWLIARWSALPLFALAAVGLLLAKLGGGRLRRDGRSGWVRCA